MTFDGHSQLAVVAGESAEVEVVLAEQLLSANCFIGRSGCPEDVCLYESREPFFLH